MQEEPKITRERHEEILRALSAEQDKDNPLIWRLRGHTFLLKEMPDGAWDMEEL